MEATTQTQELIVDCIFKSNEYIDENPDFFKIELDAEDIEKILWAQDLIKTQKDKQIESISMDIGNIQPVNESDTEGEYEDSDFDICVSFFKVYEGAFYAYIQGNCDASIQCESEGISIVNGKLIPTSNLN